MASLTRADVTRQAELVAMEYLKSRKCTQTLDAMMQHLASTHASPIASELYATDLDTKKRASQAHTSVLEFMVHTSMMRIASATTAAKATSTAENGDASNVKASRSRAASTMSAENDSSNVVWSKDDVSRLRKAIKQTSAVEDTNARWREIAVLVGDGKSKKHCYAKYKALKDERKSSSSASDNTKVLTPTSKSSGRSSSSSKRSSTSSDTAEKSSTNRQEAPDDQERGRPAAAAVAVVAVPSMQPPATSDGEKRAALHSEVAFTTRRDALRSIDDTVLAGGNSGELQMEDVDDFDSAHVAPTHNGKPSSSSSSNSGGARAVGSERAGTRASGSGSSSKHTQSRAPSADEVTALQCLFFSDAANGFSTHWDQQGFYFTDVANLRYGLVQNEGGPCGVLAVVQAYILRFLLENAAAQDWQNPDPTQQQSLLVAAMTHILHQASSSGRCIVALNDRAATSNTTAAKRKFMSGVMLHTTATQDETHTLLMAQLAQLMAPRGNGLVLFVLSAALTKGVTEIQREMDHIEGVSEASGRLIGAHDYCTQEMVNLLLCGQACSNVFNGRQLLEGSSEDDPKAVVLKGVAVQATVGFLSLFEAYEYLVVGSHLKSPAFNVWVVCSESHYSVLFAEPTLLRDAALDTRTALDLYYYDELANQDEVIRLSVAAAAGDDDEEEDGGAAPKKKRATDLVPPMNLVIQTKWPRARVDWHDVEPLL